MMQSNLQHLREKGKRLKFRAGSGRCEERGCEGTGEHEGIKRTQL